MEQFHSVVFHLRPLLHSSYSLPCFAVLVAMHTKKKGGVMSRCQGCSGMLCDWVESGIFLILPTFKASMLGQTAGMLSTIWQAAHINMWQLPFPCRTCIDWSYVLSCSMTHMQQLWRGSAGRSTGGLKAASYATKLNANAASAKRSQAQSAATFQAALEYRRQQQALADTAAVSAAASEAASEADTLATAADTMLAAAAVAKTAAAAVKVAGDDRLLDPVSSADAALPAESSSNGPGNGTNNSNGLTAQRAQQNRLLANGRQAGSQHAQRDQAATNGGNRAAAAPNNGKRRGLFLNGTQRHETRRGSSDDTGGAGDVNDQLHAVPQTNGLPPSQALANGARRNTAGPPDGSLASAPRPSASEVADDAMTAAIASIHSQQADPTPKTPAGAKAVPTPSLNASPRIKSALLAAQEYRKQKAAKTAALAIAAANAAKAAAKGGDVPQ